MSNLTLRIRFCVRVRREGVRDWGPFVLRFCAPDAGGSPSPAFSTGNTPRGFFFVCHPCLTSPFVRLQGLKLLLQTRRFFDDGSFPFQIAFLSRARLPLFIFFLLLSFSPSCFSTSLKHFSFTTFDSLTKKSFFSFHFLFFETHKNKNL